MRLHRFDSNQKLIDDKENFTQTRYIGSTTIYMLSFSNKKIADFLKSFWRQF